MIQRGLLGWILIGITTVAFGQSAVYQSVQPDGSLSFSDTPTENSQLYAVTGANISDFSSQVSATSPNATGSVSGATVLGSDMTAGSTSYSDVTIMQPVNQTTFHSQEPIGVSVVTSPALRPGDLVQLVVDGLPIGEPQASLQFTVGDLVRGTHQLQARVVNSNGQTLKMSLTTTIFKQQASVLLPTTPPPSAS